MGKDAMKWGTRKTPKTKRTSARGTPEPETNLVTRHPHHRIWERTEGRPAAIPFMAIGFQTTRRTRRVAGTRKER
jgi:hypothetical protein